MMHKKGHSRKTPRQIPPPRPVRFSPEEDLELQAAARKFGCSVSQVIRLCVRTVRPGTLKAEYITPEDFLRNSLARRVTIKAPRATSKTNGTNGTNGHERLQP